VVKQRTFILTSIVIFFVVGLLHLFRSIYSMPANIGGFQIPLWLSYVVVVLTAYLWYWGNKLVR